MDNLKEDVAEFRENKHNVDPLFLNRWSPRAMSGESIDDKELMALFEAARWAPSSYNNQSWRFVYAKRDEENWDNFLDLLVDGNKVWAKNGSALVVILSKKTFDYNGKFSRTHSFDTGAAWQNFALEGSRRGLVVHGMQGFDYEKAHTLVDADEELEVEAMVVVGKPGKVESLPKDLREGEKPSGRKNLDKIVFNGSF